MKRYLIPILAILVIGVATYFWTSRGPSHKAIAKARHAHLDSLRIVQMQRASAQPKLAMSATDSMKMLDSLAMLTEDSALGTVWATKQLASMPDSIRPQDFSEASVKYDFDFDSEVAADVMVDDTSAKLDTLATKIAQRNNTFINQTVMAMLIRHLKNSVNTDEFSRCPSGYYFVTNNMYVSPAPPEPDWDTGTVYFGAGCNDTALCDFRFNYSKRIVEMKDINSTIFHSIREYELMKFSQYATLAKKE